MSTYKDHHNGPSGGPGVYPSEVTHSWVAHTRRALVWHYGDERAHFIMTGRDPATQADIARWNALGRGRDAA